MKLTREKLIKDGIGTQYYSLDKAQVGGFFFCVCVCVCVCALLSKHRKHCSWNIMVEADEVLPPAPILI